MTDEISRNSLPFGHALRAKRVEKKFGLRKFAELVGVSPTYLSQVEHCNVMPPTADRVGRMAELLGESSDEWIAMAGRVPDDISRIISEQPAEVPPLLRIVRGMTAAELRKLRKVAESIKNERG